MQIKVSFDQQLNTIDEKIKSLLQTVEQKIQDATDDSAHNSSMNMIMFINFMLTHWTILLRLNPISASSSVKNQVPLGCLIVCFSQHF